MNQYIYPYMRGSQSVRNLKDALSARVIKLQGSTFRERPSKQVINWGSSDCPYGANTLNRGEAVALASHKTRAFVAMEEAGVLTVPFTTSMEEARLQIVAGAKIYCRTVLTGHSGNGIVVASTPEELVQAPLYTTGITGGRREYRIHVANGQVILKQTKRRRNGGSEQADNDVRNHGNGWVFAITDVNPSQQALDESIKAITALGLDFGAVDIIENSRGPQVLEVNTAPALQGTTLEAYVTAFSNWN